MIIDTNVEIGNPYPREWKTSLNNPFFVFSQSVLIELEHLKQRKDKKEKAEKAINTLNNILYKEIGISLGIYMEGIGWFL